MTSDQLKQFRLKAIQQGYSTQDIGNYLSSGDSFEDRQSSFKQKQEIQPVPSASQGGGFLKSVVKGIANPFLKLGATADALGTSKYLGGKGTDNTPKNTPLGPVKPITNAREVIGVGAELAGFAAGGAGKGLGLLGKVGAGAGTGYAFDVGSKLQDPNKSVGQSFTPGIGTAVGAVLPGVGAVVKPVTKIISRLVKGLGSGLSGVSTDTIDKIVSNPKVAQQASLKLAQSGNNKILEQNAKIILNGVSKIQAEASSAYRKGLDELSAVDIKPEALKQGFFKALEKNKIKVTKGKIDFSGADFLDPKIQAKAETVIKQINGQKDLSGAGVRKLIDIVDNARFKSAPDGERLAFNAFIGDLKQGLKEGVNQSTDKLSQINAKYSADMQLSDAMQDIFGNVNFKNLSEVVKASQKLETMFAQKGLAPQVVDDFLARIGISPADFKTGEAIRQISNKQATANPIGTNFGELTRAVTSAIITPQMVRDLSIRTGLAREALIPFLQAVRKMAPAMRTTILKALVGNSETQPQDLSLTLE